MITSVNFNTYVQVGPDAYPETRLVNGDILGAYRLTLELDANDSRFVLLTGKAVGSESKLQQYFQWIPLTSISTLLLNERPAHGFADKSPKATKA